NVNATAMDRIGFDVSIHPLSQETFVGQRLPAPRCVRGHLDVFVDHGEVALHAQLCKATSGFNPRLEVIQDPRPAFAEVTTPILVGDAELEDVDERGAVVWLQLEADQRWDRSTFVNGMLLLKREVEG